MPNPNLVDHLDAVLTQEGLDSVPVGGRDVAQHEGLRRREDHVQVEAVDQHAQARLQADLGGTL